MKRSNSKNKVSPLKLQIPLQRGRDFQQISLIIAFLLTAYVHGENPATIFKTLNMDGKAITNAATPGAGSPPSQVATKQYVDNATNSIIVTPLSTVSNQFLLTSGGNAMTGELDAGTNKVTNVADPTANLDAVNLQYLLDLLGVSSDPIEIIKSAVADTNVIFCGIVSNKLINTLEWDLQSFTTVDDLQYSPFHVSRDLITAEQYCRFLNAWSNRFSNKSAPACVVTSVMNTAQRGAWVDVQSPGGWQLCTIGSSTTKNSAQINWNGSNYVVNAYPDDPMILVSWYGAVGYCQWLNEVEFGGNTNLWKYRLPTEWEYEFQMGARQVSERILNVQDWGSTSWTYGQGHGTINTTANATDWVNYNSAYGWVVTVGGKGGDGRNARNTFGAYDMSGQVWKWCLDWYGASAGDVSGKDYVYRTTGSLRSIRGGYWGGNASGCASSRRSNGSPTSRSLIIGFRVVREHL